MFEVKQTPISAKIISFMPTIKVKTSSTGYEPMPRQQSKE
jgi:hypothetical protein